MLKDYLFHISRDTGKLVRNINTATDTVMMSLRVAMIFFTDLFMFIGLDYFDEFNKYIFCFKRSINRNNNFNSIFLFFKKILITYGEFTFEFQGEALKRLLQTFTMIKEIKIFKKRKIFY